MGIGRRRSGLLNSVLEKTRVLQDKSIYCVEHTWNVLSSDRKAVWGHGKKGLGFHRGVIGKGVFIRKHVLVSSFQRSEKHFIWYLCFNFWHLSMYLRLYHCNSGIIYILQINNFFFSYLFVGFFFLNQEP